MCKRKHRIARSKSRPGLIAGILFLGLGLLGGCGREKPPHPSQTQGPRRPRPDRAEPGELAEGKVTAFGLKLPRGCRITGNFSDAIHVEGRIGFAAATNFVRQRVDAARVDTGPSKTVFVDAKLKGNADTLVGVEVSRHDGRVRIVVRDRTPKAVQPGLTDKERWKKTGLSETGKLPSNHRLE